ncbi:unnamed protein product [marine sediment metagenome]|uniref:Uncharacterized protein n=1 Tax=marine sediment metagenome TaxID=412755 RepID=X1A9Z2_9ZZZZ
MKIQLYKRTAEGCQVLFIPGRAAHLPPVLLRVRPDENLKEKVAAELLSLLPSSP